MALRDTFKTKKTLKKSKATENISSTQTCWTSLKKSITQNYRENIEYSKDTGEMLE